MYHFSVPKIVLTLLFSICIAFVAAVIIPDAYVNMVMLLVVLIIFGSIFTIVYTNIFWKHYSFLEKLLSITLLTSFFGAGLFSYNIGPITLFPFRIFLFLFLFIVVVGLLKGTFTLKEKVYVQPIIWFFFLWFLYALISISWSPAVDEGIKEIFYLFTGVSIVIFVVVTYDHVRNYVEFYWIWIIMSAVLIIIGAINHFWGYHLPISRIYTAPITQKYIPTAVFVNENDYASFLAISFFFLISSIHRSSYVPVKILGTAFAFLAAYLLFVTSSRANYLAVMIGLFFWFLLFLNKKEKVKFLFSGTIFLGFILFFLFEKIEKIFSLLMLQISTLLTETKVAEASVDIRMNLIKNAMHFIANTFGFGVGAGNVEYYMKNHGIYNTFSDYNMHNWWMEIFVQYGFFIFACYVIIFLYLIVEIYKIYLRTQKSEVEKICEALFCGLLAFPLASISPNSFMALTYNWVFIAFAVGFVNVYKKSVAGGT
ncbi:O-antigen ligase family protein [Anoxybacillus gonensis]|uniref:O-antigen ligase family protein n=1 Tax=Anoxybacillus gonensis TaxID=198467 RepID=UPI0002BE2AC7|nr:O-antigen ligase family protein [Anoxybacillus gonensis]EMI09522.1 TuaE [Anoxybacillus gonensis]